MYLNIRTMTVIIIIGLLIGLGWLWERYDEHRTNRYKAQRRSQPSVAGARPLELPNPEPVDRMATLAEIQQLVSENKLSTTSVEKLERKLRYLSSYGMGKFVERQSYFGESKVIHCPKCQEGTVERSYQNGAAGIYSYRCTNPVCDFGFTGPAGSPRLDELYLGQFFQELDEAYR